MQYRIYPCVLPCEGGRTFPVKLDFSADNNQIVDFLSSESQGRLSQIRSVYIDNLANNSKVEFGCPVSGQIFDIPANSAGYMPLEVPNPPYITVTCAGSAKVVIEFLNFYTPPYLFGAAIQGTVPTTGGFIELEDGSGFFALEDGSGLILLE